MCIRDSLNLLSGLEPNPEPMLMNTCYSFVDAKNVIHVASVHHYDCLLYTSDAADERSSVDLGGRRIIKNKQQKKKNTQRKKNKKKPNT